MKKPTAVFDIECYKNYFLISFLDVDTGIITSFERRENVHFDFVGVKKQIDKYKLVGFNCEKYDVLMLSAAMKGKKNLKEVSDSIINFRLMPWDFEDRYDIKPLKVDMIDLIEVAPGIASLKTYGARLHSRTLWDLPYDIETILTDEQMDTVREYCSNDLQTTLDLYKFIQPQLKLREDMSLTYGLDLRSKSDAQIAEAVIKKLLKDEHKIDAKRPKLNDDYTFQYKAPDYLKGKLDGLVKDIEKLDFRLNDAGSVQMPEYLKKKIIKIGKGNYRMGIGGLHSSEKCLTIVADENTTLADHDFFSFYPSIIVNNRYLPKHLDKGFLAIYHGIYQGRVENKKRILTLKNRIKQLEKEIEKQNISSEG